MRTCHAVARLIGGRTHQCDATAVVAAPGGVRAFALLDGIGSDPAVRAWTRTAAGRVARAAARSRDAAVGLRQVYDRYATEPEYLPDGDPIGAAAVVVVAIPGGPLTVASSGDARAYAIRDTEVEQLTRDHNWRRVLLDRGATPNIYDRNALTSYLGMSVSAARRLAGYGHPAIESATVPVKKEVRLLLASDGAYEPHHDLGHHLATYLTGTPAEAAADFVETAVHCSRLVTLPQHVDNATALVVDLVP